MEIVFRIIDKHGGNDADVPLGMRIALEEEEEFLKVHAHYPGVVIDATPSPDQSAVMPVLVDISALSSLAILMASPLPFACLLRKGMKVSCMSSGLSISMASASWNAWLYIVSTSRPRMMKPVSE